MSASPASLPLRAAVPLVFAGGAVGTILRFAIESAFSGGAGSAPYATWLINVSGSFLLGVLVQLLAVVPVSARQRTGIRLALGTGLLGGFTTYSTFSLEVVTLGATGFDGVLLALVYALPTVAMGLLAAGAGIWLVATLGGRGGGQ